MYRDFYLRRTSFFPEADDTRSIKSADKIARLSSTYEKKPHSPTYHIKMTVKRVGPSQLDARVRRHAVGRFLSHLLLLSSFTLFQSWRYRKFILQQSAIPILSSATTHCIIALAFLLAECCN